MRAAHSPSTCIQGVRIDWEQWPVMRVTPPPYHLSDEALLDFLDAYDELTSGCSGRYGLVLDLRSAAHLGVSQRRKLTERLSAQRDALGSRCAATALVFSSVVLRSMLSAIVWLFRPPYPTRAVASLEEAESWVRDTLMLECSEQRESA